MAKELMAGLEIQPGHMPAVVRDVAAVVGPMLAMRFARQFGGRKLYLPKKMYGSHPLSRCLGFRPAHLLSLHHGGEDLIVPRCSTYLRWFDARALRLLGLSTTEIAEQLNITRRQVERLVAGLALRDAEITDAVLSVARHYRVRRRPEAAAVGCRQIDFGFPPDAKGRRFTDA